MPFDAIFPIATVVIDLGLIMVAFGLGRQWLYGTIVVNLILVSVFGAKLISLFGLITNAGNVFYAAVFFAMHILAEHYRKEESYKALWVGFFGVLLFTVLSQITIAITSQVRTTAVDEAARVLLHAIPRITLASMAAYLIAQHVNLGVYHVLHERDGKARLWIRDTAANIAGQLIDSVLFFSIAFLGTVPLLTLFEIMLVGFTVKVAVGGVGTPLLYFTRVLRREKT